MKKIKRKARKVKRDIFMFEDFKVTLKISHPKYNIFKKWYCSDSNIVPKKLDKIFDKIQKYKSKFQK